MKLKSKPIEPIRQLLILVSIIPADNGTNKWRKILYNIFGFSIFAVLLCVTTASIIFFYEHMSIDLEASLYSMAQVSAFTAMIYTIIVTFFIRHDIEAIFYSLYNICESSKMQLVLFSRYFLTHNLISDNYDYFNKLLADAQENIAWMLKAFVKYMLFGFIVASIVQHTIACLYCFTKVGHFDANFVYYPYKMTWVELNNVIMGIILLNLSNSFLYLFSKFALESANIIWLYNWDIMRCFEWRMLFYRQRNAFDAVCFHVLTPSNLLQNISEFFAANGQFWTITES